jgi:hypothetical protein
MISNTEPTSVFVRLRGEGTRVYRPVKAAPVGPDLVRLLEPTDYDPEDEDWEFKPGSVVRIERKTLEGTSSYVAVSSMEREFPPTRKSRPDEPAE